MPIALDPKAVFRVVLDVDQDKDPQPAFLYRYLPASKIRRLETLMRELKAGSVGVDTWNKIEETILTGLTGWENITDENGQPVLYDPQKPSKIFDVCTDRELGEIMAKAMAGRLLDREDRKKSEPPLPSDTKGSADAAAAT